VTPIAKRNPLLAGVPTSNETMKNTLPTPTAIRAMVRTTRSSFWASGVLGRGPALPGGATPEEVE
jgi:hypothetical protein